MASQPIGTTPKQPWDGHQWPNTKSANGHSRGLRTHANGRPLGWVAIAIPEASRFSRTSLAIAVGKPERCGSDAALVCKPFKHVNERQCSGTGPARRRAQGQAKGRARADRGAREPAQPVIGQPATTVPLKRVSKPHSAEAAPLAHQKSTEFARS
jgi:hypothetical protein